MTPKQSELAARIDAYLCESGYAMTVRDLAAGLNLPSQAVQALLRLHEVRPILIQSGDLVHSMRALASTAEDLRARFGKEPFPPRAFREHLNLTRSVADRLVEMLEIAGFLDRGPGGWRLR